jgi:hypothetical protein
LQWSQIESGAWWWEERGSSRSWAQGSLVGVCVPVAAGGVEEEGAPSCPVEGIGIEPRLHQAEIATSDGLLVTLLCVILHNR